MPWALNRDNTVHMLVTSCMLYYRPMYFAILSDNGYFHSFVILFWLKSWKLHIKIRKICNLKLNHHTEHSYNTNSSCILHSTWVGEWGKCVSLYRNPLFPNLNIRHHHDISVMACGARLSWKYGSMFCQYINTLDKYTKA